MLLDANPPYGGAIAKGFVPDGKDLRVVASISQPLAAHPNRKVRNLRWPWLEWLPGISSSVASRESSDLRFDRWDGRMHHASGCPEA